MANLFDPLTLRGVTFRNRIGISPMCQYNSVDGYPNEWHLVHLGSRAIGGAGLVIVEATGVEPRGRISPDDMGIYYDEHIEAFRPITQFMKQFGAVPGIQLAHAGRKASTANVWKVIGQRGQPERTLSVEEGGWEIVGPSAIPFRETSKTPHELTIPEIKEIQEKFRTATARALQAGFELVELHAAHGYLANSFLSPLSNHRTDEYGGTFENRIRFVIETVQGMRKEWPDHLPMSVRLSCTDWVEGGWTLEDSIALSRILKNEGVDMIDCSSGFVVAHTKVPFAPGFQVPFAEGIRKEAGIATAAVGLISEPKHANDIIEQGQADMVLLGRESIRDPYWPFRAAAELGFKDAETLPLQYKYAI